MKKILFTILLFSSFAVYCQKFEGLAKTPPMGWNTWNKFQCNVDEKLIRQTADALVSSGMKDAGYQYIIIDDCWQVKRDSLGFIQPDPDRFPSGMKALADYVHSKGLKFGIYSDAGWQTCGGKPGSRGHEYQDAMMYAKWGVDYLKYDWCNTEGLKGEGAYLTMCNALHSAGRPIVLSLCEWGGSKPWTWAKNVGHLWRTTTDITACFDCIVDHEGKWQQWGVMQNIDSQENLRAFAGPDHWNDPDMMEVGNGMSVNEDRAHFSMWCMVAAPLIAGNDIFNMKKETVDILNNKDAIAVDQDQLGIQGFRYSSKKDSLEIWIKPLTGNDWAVCFLNRCRNKAADIKFSWKDNPVVDTLSKRQTNFDKVNYSILDIWTKKNIGTTQKEIVKTIPVHDVLFVRLSPVK
jgi:alpha-galactosidase